MRPVSRLESSVASLTRCASPPRERGRALARGGCSRARRRSASRASRAMRGWFSKKSQRVVHRQLEHVGDAPPLEAHLERLAVVALALAHLARHVDVGQEVHLDLHEPVALARLAAPALHVEREAARPVAADLRLGQLGEELADRREQPGVRRRVGARRAADRALVDVDDLVDVLEPRDARVRAGDDPGAVEVPRERTGAGCPRSAWTCPSPTRR